MAECLDKCLKIERRGTLHESMSSGSWQEER